MAKRTRTRKRRAKPCPYCGSTDTSRILYGLYCPDPEHPLPDNVILGGCCIGPGSPGRRCNVCGRGSEFEFEDFGGDEEADRFR